MILKAKNMRLEKKLDFRYSSLRKRSLALPLSIVEKDNR